MACHSYARGRCSFGDECRYSHEEASSQQSQRACYDFRSGKCSYGDDCKFLHSNVPDSLPKHTTKKKFDEFGYPMGMIEKLPRAPKKTGKEWFESIGSPKRIVAPMVDASELAYRMQCRSHGAELVYTQMFSSHMFVESAEYRRQNFSTIPEDRPLIVQFAGDNPDTLLKAARMVQNHCDAVDINLGCPQGIAKRGHYGAFLMEELSLLTAIVSKLANGLDIPVTCKTRIYHDFDRTIRLMDTLVNAGASLITVHGRTREEKKQKIGACDWVTLRRIKEHFASQGIPVICNGGIGNIDDFWNCLSETGVDGCMLSEAILEDPALFSRKPTITHENMDEKDCNRRGETKTQLDIAFEYLLFASRYPPRHIKIIRGHLMRYLYRYFDQHPEVRNKMGEERTLEGIIALCEELRLLVGAQEPAYTRDWYSRHRIISPDGSRIPGGMKKDGITSVFKFGDKDWGSDDTGFQNDEESGGLFEAIGMFDDE